MSVRMTAWKERREKRRERKKEEGNKVKGDRR
jgi:hypothetical protein